MHPRAAEFVEEATERYGLTPEVREFPAGTRTAADAAEAIGCPVGAVASSLVFLVGDDPVLVVASGAGCVDESRLAARFDADPGAVGTADPETVRELTGWAIGGVPPICHATELPALFDAALLDHDILWAAAGTPEAVFAVGPERLRELVGADVADVTTRS